MKTLSKVHPLVSVVIPCYNHEKYVKECISSVIDQDYRNIELIIIDDGSIDNSVEKIKELIEVCEQRFVRFEFRVRPNRGLCETLNEGVEWSRGEFYSAVASDDIFKPNKTNIQVDYLLSKPSCVAVFGNVDIISSEGALLRSINTSLSSYKFNDIFFHRHRLPAPTQMIRLDALRKTGGYPAGMVIEDFYMWLKLSNSGGNLDKLEMSLASYRRHEGNMSGQLERMEKGRYAILDLFKSEPDYNRAKANAVMMAAIDLQPYDRTSSLKRFILAVRIYPRVIFQLKVFKYYLKAILPKSRLLGFLRGKK